jgi:hypothetical protein
MPRGGILRLNPRLNEREGRKIGGKVGNGIIIEMGLDIFVL